MSSISLTADASTRRSSSGGTARSGTAAMAPPRAAVEIAAVAGPAPASPGKVLRKETATLQVRDRPALATGAALQWQQLVALTRKNLTVRARAWKTNLLLVAQAGLFIALTWGVDRAVSASNQRKPSFSSAEVATSVAVGPIPDCSANLFMRAGQPCYTFLYAPAGDPDVQAVVRGVRERNDPPIPRAHTLGLPSSSTIDAWLLAHPETALAAVIFTPDGSSSGGSSAAGGALPTAPAGSTVGVMPGNAAGPGYGLGAASMDASTAVLLSSTSGSGGGGGSDNATARALLAASPAAAAGGPAPAAAAAPPRQLGFTVQTNSSVQWFKGQYQNPNTYIQLPLQVAVEREIVRHFTGERSLSWSVGVARFPHPSVKSPSLIGQFAPTFLFASIMFQFVLLVHDVVAEKEGRARQMMEVMGLRPLPFWASWVLFQGLLAALEACLLVGFGYAFGFKLFTRNAFGLSFLLLLLVSLAMTAFGFFVAAFLRKASAAVPCGFLLFVVAWVIIIVVAFGFPFAPGYSQAAVGAFSAMPWALLAKGVQDLADASQGRNAGIPWADRFAYCQPGSSLEPGVHLAGSNWAADCVMPLGDMFWILAVQCAGFMALAIYFDAVLPDANGVQRPPWFFLLPGYWRRGGRGNLRAAAKALGEPTESECGLSVDTDVAEESNRQRKRCAVYLRQAGGGSAAPAEAVLLPAQVALMPLADSGAAGTAGTAPAAGAAGAKLATGEGEDPSLAGRPYAVEMFGLRKAYKRGGLLRRRKPFVAVRGNWLGVHQGECFCLLGPNGAGKSTTINCLTGVLPFSAGDALVCGTSIASAGGMDRVRPLMGVCPQFDVLWEQLTGREHLLLFGAIKGLPASERATEAARLLEDVKLTEASGVRAGSYSGGMKRRLSVAIALLGDPQVVYLDEPTTGLDPISRRHLWDLVDRVKRGRAVVLTTHSMEEADILGDRIGIMARGRLRCLGTSLRLKARFGSGYRVSIRVQGSSGSGDSATADADSGSAAGAMAGGIPSAGARLGLEDCEIQPAPLAVQPGLHPAAPPQRSGSNHSGRSVSGEPAEQAQQRDPVAARQAGGVKALFLRQLGIKPVDESLDYVHFLVPYEHEDRLPALFAHIKAHQAALGVADVQLRLTPLEEVFLTVARKAELEHAQLEGRHEALTIAEEGLTVQVPIGADFIQTPAGHLYHIRWGQDADTGELRLRDYWRDPLSGQGSAEAAVAEPLVSGGGIP